MRYAIQAGSFQYFSDSDLPLKEFVDHLCVPNPVPVWWFSNDGVRYGEEIILLEAPSTVRTDHGG